MSGKEVFEIVLGIANIFILGITCYFIYRSIYSPVDAVKIGRQLNTEKQKDDAKRNLFLLLFSLRGSAITYDFVRGLNQIDVVFEDTPEVLSAWHIHYDSLHIKGQVDEDKIWELQRTNLLSAMAVSLGYNRIRQTDMIKSYFPEGHGNRLKNDFEFREAERKFYEMGAIVYQIMIDKTLEQEQASKSKDPIK